MKDRSWRRALRAIRSFGRARGGNVYLFGALAIPAALMAVVVSVDHVRAYSARSDVQNALDAATLTAARLRDDDVPEAQWRSRAAELFWSNLQGEGVARGADPTFTADGEATVGAFRGEIAASSGLFGPNLPVKADARAVWSGTAIRNGGCVILLDPDDEHIVNSSAEIDLNCAMQINSANRRALHVNGEVRAFTYIHGGLYRNSGSEVAPDPIVGAPILPDPLADLPDPAEASGPCATYDDPNQPGVQAILDWRVPNTPSTVTLPAGRHCGNIYWNTGRLELEPGVHVFDNALAPGGGVIVGDGVLLYTRGNFNINAGVSFRLRPMSSGVYAGVTLFQARGNTNAFIVNGGVIPQWSGVFYLPDGSLQVNSDATFTGDIALIMQRLEPHNGLLRIQRPSGACAATASIAPAVHAKCGAPDGARGLPRGGDGRRLRLDA